MSRRRILLGQQGERLVEYGYLYNWYVTQGTGSSSIIPSAMASAGWAIGDNTTYNTLYSALSASTIKIQYTSLSYWSLILSQTNEFNMDTRGSGMRVSNGSFSNIKQSASLWGSELNTTDSWFWTLGNITNNTILASSSSKKSGLALRLVRPATPTEQLQADGTVTQDGYTGNDGFSYPIVKIGTQMWLQCNLAETKYRDGSSIPNIADDTAWSNLTTGALCAYNNDINNVFI